MSLTDEQFQKLLGQICQRQEDHDAIIDIKGMLNGLQNVVMARREADVERLSGLEKSATKAHSRIDDTNKVLGRLMSVGGVVNIAVVVTLIIALLKK